MSHPLLLEINTRCWLRDLSDRLGKRVSLATVPEQEFASWKKSGFTHIWLMGVWATGLKTRDLARNQTNLRDLSAQAFGRHAGATLISSPYAVAGFKVAKSLGGETALRQFRAQLHRHGLGLVLDFIPNHLSLDHPWLTERNNLFVRSATERPETYRVCRKGSTYWVAHGKDPFWPAWIDTVQLDYRLQSTRAAMLETLQSVAARCDGVRCDTAMLLLNDVFNKTWAHFPRDSPAPQDEFWAGAISAVKQRQPGFLFIAEAYWDLEPRLQALGFDYSYDKKFLDHVARREYPALQRHARAVAGTFSPVRFLENHDEARIASLLTAPEQKAAAVLLLAQPGLRLLHDGQMAGRERHTPVQFARYWPETGDPEMAAFYERLLSSLQHTAIGSDEMEFRETGLPHCFAMHWKQQGGRHTWVLVNLAPQPSRFFLDGLKPTSEIRNVFSDSESRWALQGRGMQVDLAACGFVLLAWRSGYWRGRTAADSFEKNP